VHKVALISRFANRESDEELADKVQYFSKRALVEYAKINKDAG